MQTTRPMCTVCVHYNGDMTCTAFPDDIPDAIFLEHKDHRESFKGDKGITFEPDQRKKAKDISLVLSTYDE